MNSAITLLLAAIVLWSSLPITVNGQDDLVKRRAKAEQVKIKIRELGQGEKSIVSIKLYDGRRIKGYVREAADDDFVIVDQTGSANPLRYTDVSSISGKNMSTGTKIAIGVGIGAGATLLVLFLVFRHITRNN